jgi:L-asparaginase
LDADLGHALSVAALLRRNLHGARGAVVIHGTDTLAYVAAVAAFALSDVSVPIIFTGSQRSVREEGSDADANFAAAYRAALCSPSGVQIAFGGALIPAVRAIKHSSEADAAFAAVRAAAPGGVGIAAAPWRFQDFSGIAVSASGSDAPSVGLLRVFPGLKPDLVRAAARLYPDGLVLECYGTGTAPVSSPGMLRAVAEAADAGIPIVVVTQCQTGSVRLERYALGGALQRAGVWSGGDLTADAALAKLGVLAALGLDREERRIAFTRNLVGEQGALG